MIYSCIIWSNRSNICLVNHRRGKDSNMAYKYKYLPIPTG